MPKKGKKGGKKGKKGGKKEKKEESIEKKAIANERIWQARLRTTELTKNDFREQAKQLSEENDMLQTQMRQIELDTIDVVTFLKTQDQKKDAVVDKLEGELKKVDTQQEQEMKTLVQDYTEQIRSLEEQINKKQDDIVLMQNELKHVKEFRKKRVVMQRELDAIKDTMFLADREHKQEIDKLTQKFEDVKVAMQQDTDHKISVLADKAHQEAITNLDENTRSIYKENVRLTEALRFHKLECDKLRANNQELEQDSERLRLEQDDKELLVQEKVAHSQGQKHAIHEYEDKVTALEAAVNDMVTKYKKEQKTIKKFSNIELESSQVEITKLERLLQLKSLECAKVRKLARSILSQRTDVESNFLHSLDQIKEEYSISSGVPKHRIMISDIPWELRELVLRTLFVRMNSFKKPIKQSISNQLTEGDNSLNLNQDEVYFGDQDDIDKDLTFLTQGDIVDLEPAVVQ